MFKKKKLKKKIHSERTLNENGLQLAFHFCKFANKIKKSHPKHFGVA